MYFNSILATGILLASGQIAFSASLLPVRDDDQCRRAQLHGCTGSDFTGNCEDTDLGYTGICYRTSGIFRDGLVSVRSEYPTGTVLFTNQDCTGDPLWVDTEGQSNIKETQYQSYVGIFIPEYS